VRFLTDTTTTSLRGRRGNLELELESAAGGRFTLAAERVLCATGRRPALEGLDLDKAAIAMGDDGAPLLDASLRTSNPRVWMAGDAGGGVQLTPVANFEGEHVARSILTGRPQTIDLSSMPTTVFTIPQVAQVGMTEAAARAAAVPYVVAHGDFEYIAQAIITDQRSGLVKLIATDDGRLKGAVIAGPHAGDLIYGLALAVRSGMSLEQLQTTRAIHPSLSEALNFASFAATTAVMPAAA
jgi:pyruvate/2-oxoglutarate dehydrogenase complex dihydrolipoamide dehydrogenase (E3) component